MLLLFVLLFSTSIYAQSGYPAGADSVQMSLLGDITVDVGGIRESVDFSSVIAASAEGNDIEMNMSMSVPVLQQLIGASNLQFYFKDGYAYLAIQDFKVKTRLPMDSLTAVAAVAPSVAEAFPVELLQVQAMNYTPEGNMSLSIAIDGDALTEHPMMAIESYWDGRMYYERLPLDLDDITVNVVLTPAGELVSMRMVYGFSSAVGGLQMRASYDVTTQILQAGGVTVNFPADLDNYYDITSILAMYI
jgi:hypothetical protein